MIQIIAAPKGFAAIQTATAGIIAASNVKEINAVSMVHVCVPNRGKSLVMALVWIQMKV